MQNENRYVPPALRHSAGDTQNGDSRNDNLGYGGGSGGGGYGNQRQQGNYDNGGGNGFSGGAGFGGRGGDYRSRDQGNYGSNSRWQDNNSGGYQGGGYQGGGGGGGYHGGRGGGGGQSYNRGGSSFYNGDGGGGGGGGGYSDRGGGGGYGAKKNAMGFHGDDRPNPKMEQELFHTNEVQTAGINFDKYDDIPVEVSEGCPEPFLEFTIETVGPQLLKNLALTKYLKPTPVQKYSIPIGVSGGDMMACAQTGSGKTAGFLFPVISLLLKRGPSPEPEGRRPKSVTYISALILAPTRELVSQIYDEAAKFCYCTGIRPVVVYGGANILNQLREIERGADLIVATPGRLVDIIQRGRIKLDIVQFLVLDEADRMLDMGFEPQIRRIVEQEGMPRERQTFMFSATFPVEIQRLAADFMRDYVFLAVGRVGAASKDVTQRIEWVDQHDKINFVIDFLARVEAGLVLIFVETKRGADHLEELLCRDGYPASSIHGDKSQREREDALKSFKTGRTPILVATDVAARGLDIPNVTQVINFDMPSNIDDYVHRIGRTGRVGNIGHALSMMNDKNRNTAKELADLLIENEQICPPWLENMAYSGGMRSGGGGRGRGRGKQFGARDARRDGGGGGGHSNGGARNGGGGGYGGSSAPRGGGWSAEPASNHSYGGGGGGGNGGARYPDDNSAW